MKKKVTRRVTFTRKASAEADALVSG